MYVSMLALTLTNPTTILSFAALFAGLGLGGGERASMAAPAMVFGVFVGSALWWLILTGGIATVRRRLTGRLLRSVNVASGLAVLGFGLLALGAGSPSVRGGGGRRTVGCLFGVKTQAKNS